MVGSKNSDSHHCQWTLTYILVIGRYRTCTELTCDGCILAQGFYFKVYIGCGPLTVTVTTRIITFLVGDPYKPSFATVTGKGPPPRYTLKIYHWNLAHLPSGFHQARCSFHLELVNGLNWSSAGGKPSRQSSGMKVPCWHCKDLTYAFKKKKKKTNNNIQEKWTLWMGFTGVMTHPYKWSYNPTYNWFSLSRPGPWKKKVWTAYFPY